MNHATGQKWNSVDDTALSPAVASRRRVEEALTALRDKPIRATTMERLRLIWEADRRVRGLPQPSQLGEGLCHILEQVSTPVNPTDLILGRTLEEVPDEDGEAWIRTLAEATNGRGTPDWMADGGHECFAWDRLLRMGLPGLEDFAHAEAERHSAAGEPLDRLEFLRGAIRIYRAFQTYARRYRDAAVEAALVGGAAACGAIAERPPESFREALQLVWLVGHVYCTILARNPTLTFGRMDEMLLGYYRKDLALGRLTREEAGDLIQDFYCKNNLILGRGEHQMSGDSEQATGWLRNPTYDAPQYMVLGGRRRDGSAAANELTDLFLERIVPRFENPVIVLRYTPDLPEKTWRLACDRMRANASFMVYNDEKILPAMIGCGIVPEDAIAYTMHGCNWPDIPGHQRAIQTHWVSLPQVLIRALSGAEGEVTSVERLYERFVSMLRAEVEKHCDAFRADRDGWGSRSPGVLRADDCFLEGPIPRARSWRFGGVKYPSLVLALAGIATAADGFAAVDEVVFATGILDCGAFEAILASNYEGQEPLRRRCVRAPKYGQDDERADRHAVRILDEALREIDRAARPDSPDGVFVFTCLETDMNHIRFGRQLGATPDGRHAGQPISENTSPSPGSCGNGLTAMLRSVAKLPFHRIHSGALNVRLQPRLFRGEEGLERLASVLRTYFETGGLQVQLSFADTEELRDAQMHPERHRDLMVRITGYSAAFTDMSRGAQDEIIRREEMGN